MNLDKSDIRKLNVLAKKIKKQDLFELFRKDSKRYAIFHSQFLGINFDYSKNFIDKSFKNIFTKNSLLKAINNKIDDLLNGKKVNSTEERSVGHFWLRQDSKNKKIQKYQELIDQEETKFLRFAEQIRNGQIKSFSDEIFTDVISIGIGGSDLGPLMINEALSNIHDGKIKLHYISNVDQEYTDSIIRNLNPKKTLILVISKTFTTIETIENAKYLKKWLEKSNNGKSVDKNLVAITTNSIESERFGITKNQTFLFWDWIGGRYSLFSSVGMSIAIGYGSKIFMELKKGAGDYDQIILKKKLENNPSFWHAVVSIWNLNFMNFNSLAVIPYSSLLSKFPSFLQQTWMESNGKSVEIDGKKSQLINSPIIFGEPGTNSQHSFFQMIQQGNQVIPVDFILVRKNYGKDNDFHDQLIANALAQSMTMMKGKNREELAKESVSSNLIKHKIMPGNRPSNIIWIEKLNAYYLGQLIAFYEISIMIQGFLLNINSFDQFGVELGKKNAIEIFQKIKRSLSKKFDQSTEENIKFFNKN